MADTSPPPRDSGRASAWRLETIFRDGQYVHRGPSMPGSNTASGQAWKRHARLGKGTYGEVFLEKLVKPPGSTDSDVRESEQYRAVKVLGKIFEGTRLNWEDEIDALIRVSERHRSDLFVVFQGWFEHDNAVHLVTEFAPFGDLEALPRRRDGPFDETNTRAIVRQVAQAIWTLHDLDIVHRDIKLSNILVFNDGPHWQVKLADFGFTKPLLAGGSSVASVFGTYEYWAPEMRFGGRVQRKHTKPVDIWALGCIAYRLLTTRLPIGPDDYDYSEDNIRNPLVENRVTPSVVEYVVDMLSKDPMSRPTAGRLFQDGHWLQEPGSNFPKSGPTSPQMPLETLPLRNGLESAPERRLRSRSTLSSNSLAGGDAATSIRPYKTTPEGLLHPGMSTPVFPSDLSIRSIPSVQFSRDPSPVRGPSEEEADELDHQGAPGGQEREPSIIAVYQHGLVHYFVDMMVYKASDKPRCDLCQNGPEKSRNQAEETVMFICTGCEQRRPLCESCAYKAQKLEDPHEADHLLETWNPMLTFSLAKNVNAHRRYFGDLVVGGQDKGDRALEFLRQSCYIPAWPTPGRQLSSRVVLPGGTYKVKVKILTCEDKAATTQEVIGPIRAAWRKAGLISLGDMDIRIETGERFADGAYYKRDPAGDLRHGSFKAFPVHTGSRHTNDLDLGEIKLPAGGAWVEVAIRLAYNETTFKAGPPFTWRLNSIVFEPVPLVDYLSSIGDRIMARKAKEQAAQAAKASKAEKRKERAAKLGAAAVVGASTAAVGHVVRGLLFNKHDGREDELDPPDKLDLEG